jgi:KipI family sensor histidine kinase inhibitor
VTSEYRILPAGDTALIVEFGERIDRAVSTRVLALTRRLDEARLAGVIETVPTFRSLMLCFDPLAVSADALAARIADLMPPALAAAEPGRVWRLPACYDAHVAPDLDAVAAAAGLSPRDVIERHSATAYHVYMLGFLPGQAYMGDVPAELALPRRPTPRPRIPAGSLAMTSTMTCIFPLETPCGWHVIGRSPVPLWQRGPRPQALLRPGDTVRFAPVSLGEYGRLAAHAADGTLEIRPDESPIGAAA